PSYQGADNEGARAVYQQALPGYTVVLINSDASITSGGSIHCVTQQVPASSVVMPPPPPPPPPPSLPNEEAAADVPLAIPDANTTGVTSSLNFASAVTVAQALVSVEITHSYIGDLQVVLTCPGGNSVTLHDHQGGGADNLSATYPVTACDGQSAQGVWKLKVVDTVRQDMGTLTGWKVRIGN
ncbi:MAG: proprotein convertase P-domain-containing protein, partial [Myxococcaceae bacterium]